MLKSCLLTACLSVLMITGCDGGGGGGGDPDIPPGLDLLESACPGEDIVAVPITEGYAWECITSEGEDFIAGTLSDLSMADCFSTVSRTDAFCGIEVTGRASFAASHHEFDLQNPPPIEELGCDPEIAVSIEEVECRTVRLP